MYTIAITGATGHLGRLILSHLVKKVTPNSIIALTRTIEKAKDLEAKGVSIRKADYDDKNSLLTAFNGVDVLMFISSHVGKRKRQHTDVVKAACTAGVKHIVYTSLVNMEHENMLQLVHSMTEDIIKVSGMDFTFLRDNLYVDMYQVEVEIAMRTGKYRTPSRNGAAFISRDNVADCAATVLSNVELHRNKIYNLSGSSIVMPEHFSEIASHISGRPIKLEHIYWWELAKEYTERGMPESEINFCLMLEQLIADGVFAIPGSDVESILGKRPESFEEFMMRKINANINTDNNTDIKETNVNYTNIIRPK